jgi:hypothetical protein
VRRRNGGRAVGWSALRRLFVANVDVRRRHRSRTLLVAMTVALTGCSPRRHDAGVVRGREDITTTLKAGARGERISARDSRRVVADAGRAVRCAARWRWTVRSVCSNVRDLIWLKTSTSVARAMGATRNHAGLGRSKYALRRRLLDVALAKADVERGVGETPRRFRRVRQR